MNERGEVFISSHYFFFVDMITKCG